VGQEGQISTKKKEPAHVGPALNVRTDYRVDATAAAGCKLMETILVPITSPETESSTTAAGFGKSRPIASNKLRIR
jgi:hypothetical protein